MTTVIPYTPCRTCDHADHMHPSGGPCRAVTISGPSSDKGKPVGDSYDHAGREETTCECPGYAGRNGAQKK